ncbi:MAG TPA: response regulator [Polyangiaceae bacterium]
MRSPPKRAAVLIVEDEGIIAQNVQELLTGLGYDAFAIATTSAEAVAQASERCPDVVLMDIRIGGELDGIATAALLRQRFDVPIIYLTALADEATLDRAKRTEPHGYLVKPIRPADLQSAIEIALFKHAMERRLRVRERWFSTTVRSISDAIITVDLGGKITFMNPSAEALLAIDLADATGRAASDVLHLLGADSRPDEGTPLERALRERRPVEMREAVLKNAAGSSMVIEDSAAPVIDAGEVLGAVMVFRDVTEHKRLQKQLELADRLASLGTMAAGVAHEVNNPLSAVIANAQFVEERMRDVRDHLISDDAAERRNAECTVALQELLSAASRIGRIVSDLNAFSRPQHVVPGPLAVGDAVQWAIRSTAHEFRHRARVSTRLGEVPRVDADETRLGQVLVNLLINAAHAIAPGDAANNEVSIATRTDDDGRVVIQVTDTGCGMPPEVLRRIFEPFFTTKAVGVGTGLGLSICHGIVASMGGQLDVESLVGKGSTFFIRLPASVDRAPQSPPPPPPVGPKLRGRLLAIDDEALVLKVVGRVLEEHEIVSMQSPRDALELLKGDDQFDVIVCDLMMPDMTGMDFYERLLRLRAPLARRVVFLTGGALTKEAAAFLEAVPNQYLEKPFDVQGLRNLVQQILVAGARN